MIISVIDNYGEFEDSNKEKTMLDFLSINNYAQKFDNVENHELFVTMETLSFETKCNGNMIPVTHILQDRKIYHNVAAQRQKALRKMDSTFGNLLDSTIDFTYQINFHSDPDCPIDKKVFRVTKYDPYMLLEDDCRTVNRNGRDISEEFQNVISSTSFSYPKYQKSLYYYKNCDPSSYYVLNRPFRIYLATIPNLLYILQNYWKAKTAIQIIINDFRVSDFMENSDTLFHMALSYLYGNAKDISKKKRVEIEIDENKMKKTFAMLYGWNFPEPGDQNILLIAPKKIKILGSKFYYLPIPSNPICGFFVKKSFYNSEFTKLLYETPSFIQCTITAYQNGTYEEKDVFTWYPTTYSGVDLLFHLQTILNLLSIKYSGPVEAVLNTSFGNLQKRSLILRDQYYGSSNEVNMLNRVLDNLIIK